MEKIIPGYLVGFRSVHDLCRNDIYDFTDAGMTEIRVDNRFYITK